MGDKLEVSSIRTIYSQMSSPISLRDQDRASYTVIYPSKKVTIPKPDYQIDVEFDEIAEFDIPEVIISYLPDVIVSKTGVIIWGNNTVLAESMEGSLEENGFQSDGSLPIDTRSIPYSDDIILNINRRGLWNYSLFLAEVLPNALIASMNGLTYLRTPMHFDSFVDQSTIDRRKELLECFNVLGPALNESSSFVKYRGVVFVKTNDRYANYRSSQVAPMVTGVLRNKYALRDRGLPKKLYVSRQNSTSRRVSNFSELDENVLKPFGITAVSLDAMSIACQIDMFCKADLVVAEHGAGLVNTMFMRPGQSVVEIFPRPLTNRMMYRLISATTKLRYHCGAFHVPDDWIWHRDDVKIPCKLYTRLIEVALQ